MARESVFAGGYYISNRSLKSLLYADFNTTSVNDRSSNLTSMSDDFEPLWEELLSSRGGCYGVFSWLIYTILCAIADVVDIALGSNIRSETSPSSVDSLTDEELLKRRPSFFHPLLLRDADPLKYTLPLLTDDTVCKLSYMHVCAYNEHGDTMDCVEANAQILVREQTTIPVPKIRRVLKTGNSYNIIVMDRIRGQTLAQVWGGMSFLRKAQVAWTLRRYIRQLRRLKAPPGAPPGPISSLGPQKCDTPALGFRASSRGPFTSHEELTAFLNKRATMGYEADPRLPDDHPRRKSKCDDSEPLVLCHQDLNPRNIIVDEDGRIWLIDFQCAGYYPPWFENLAMQQQFGNEYFLQNGYDLTYWDLFIPFICGPYFKQEVWFTRLWLALYCK